MEEEQPAVQRQAPALTREQLELIDDGAAGRLRLADQEASNALRNGVGARFVTDDETEGGQTR